MTSQLPKVASLTADYDAIEKAMRETSRGRWFLAAYLERNRSAETHMLLNAIGKLESAMRESGRIAERLIPMETLAELHGEILAARQDVARMKKREGSPAWLPLPRFTFESLPAAVADETRAIRAAAASLDTAAAALKTAGVFQGVAREIAERATDIRQACDAQDVAMRGVSRMTALLSELEAEIMGALDSVPVPAPDSDVTADVRPMQASQNARLRAVTIPPEVVEELSAVLGVGRPGNGSNERH